MPQYRLQTVLEMREKAEEEAKQAFAAALQELAAAQAELKRLEEDLVRRKKERAQRLQEYLTKALASGSAANAMQAMNRYDVRLRDEEAACAREILQQEATVAGKQADADNARAHFAEMTKEKKAIEKHKEKWEKQVKTERATREEQNQEEIGNALHLARKRDDQRRR